MTECGAAVVTHSTILALNSSTEADRIKIMSAETTSWLVVSAFVNAPVMLND